MTTFLKKIAFFVVPVLCLLVIMELGLRNIPNDYSYKSEFLAENANEIECLILGSSHSYSGVNPKTLYHNSFNLSHVSQSINWDLELLKKYDGQWNKLKYLVVPADYFTLFSRLKAGKDSTRANKYHLYYDLGSPAAKNLHLELTQHTLDNNFKRIGKYYKDGQSELRIDSLGFGELPKKQISLIKQGLEAAKRHTKSDQRYFKKNTKILQEIIDFAEQNNIEVLLVGFPTFETYYAHLDQDQLTKSLNTFEWISSKHKNCHYYNYMFSSQFIKEDFRDADHLNKTGAKKLTALMAKSIDSLKNYNSVIKN